MNTWQPPVSMRDRWYDKPGYAFVAVVLFLSFLWWGHDQEPARIGQAMLAAILLTSVMLGRDRILTNRIAAPTQAVEVLTAAVQRGHTDNDGLTSHQGHTSEDKR